MAVKRASSVKGSRSKPSTKGSQSRPSVKSRGSVSLGKSGSTKSPKLPPPKQQKTKSTGPLKKKKKVYADKELGLPHLNMITPVGVQKPRGKKKGKIFVDDVVSTMRMLGAAVAKAANARFPQQESMATILALVNAEKEGEIESKLIRSRQLEEIREARKKEAEIREERRKGKLEEAKDAIRKKRKRGGREATANTTEFVAKPAKPFKMKKRVSFR